MPGNFWGIYSSACFCIQDSCCLKASFWRNCSETFYLLKWLKFILLCKKQMLTKCLKCFKGFNGTKQMLAFNLFYFSFVLNKYIINKRISLLLIMNKPWFWSSVRLFNSFLKLRCTIFFHYLLFTNSIQTTNKQYNHNFFVLRKF